MHSMKAKTRALQAKRIKSMGGSTSHGGSLAKLGLPGVSGGAMPSGTDAGGPAMPMPAAAPPDIDGGDAPYAKGGRVRRMDRPHRASGGRVNGKKGKTEVNIMIAPGGGQQQGQPMPVPVPIPAAGPPPPPMMKPPMPMPGGPMGPGGPPPMGMHASGGRVTRATGGRVKKRADGGEVGNDVADYMDDRAGSARFGKNLGRAAAGAAGAAALVDPEPVGKALAGAMAVGNAIMAKDSADKEDRARKGSAMWRKSGLPNVERAKGGRVPSMKAGAGSGEGRMEKAADAKKVK